MTKLSLLMALMLLGCSGSEDDDSFTCAQTDRSGTYLLQYNERSGTCGPIPETLGRIDSASALPPGCEFDAADRWSEGDCKLERAYSCLEPGVGEGVTSSAVAVTTQVDETADRIIGTLSITAFNPDGTVLCRSTYEFAATRQ